PQQVTFSVQPPSVTRYAVDEGQAPEVHPLRLVFSDSAAAVERVGKTVEAGIAVSPPVEGSWRWQDDRTLRFMPAADWPVGQVYSVQFDKARVFAPQVHLARDEFEFATAPFTASLFDGQFHQSPEDASVKQV